SVHCPEHFETTVRAIWKRPPHHFITELCPLRLDGINNPSRVLHCRVEQALGEVLRMRSEPDRGIEGTGDIHASERTDLLSQRQTFRHILLVRVSLLWIGIEKIHPSTDFSDLYINL